MNKTTKIASKGTILYIGGFELPDKNAAAQRVISNGKLLRDLGYKVVFCGMNKVESSGVVNYPQLYYNFESYALNYPKSIVQWFKYIFTYRFYLDLIKREEDVKAIICYNLPSGSLFRLTRYCNKNGIKILSDCTEWYEAPKKGNIFNRYVKRTDITLRMRNLHFKMDGIISISTFLNRYYASNNQKTVKVPPLVDISDSKWENTPKILDRPLQFIYSGSPALISESKAKDRLDLIIGAMIALRKEKRDFFMHIVGIDLESFLEICPIYRKDLKILNDIVKFYGRVPHADSVELLKASDFSIFIRDISIVTKAGFPTKFVESITCGIPVLTNKNSNIKDYLKEGKNGFWVNADSIESITDSIRAILFLKPEEINAMKIYCRDSKVFDYHNFTNKFEHILR